jgi:hypothetical protein
MASVISAWRTWSIVSKLLSVSKIQSIASISKITLGTDLWLITGCMYELLSFDAGLWLSCFMLLASLRSCLYLPTLCIKHWSYIRWGSCDPTGEMILDYSSCGFEKVQQISQDPCLLEKLTFKGSSEFLSGQQIIFEVSERNHLRFVFLNRILGFKAVYFANRIKGWK